MPDQAHCLRSVKGRAPDALWGGDPEQWHTGVPRVMLSSCRWRVPWQGTQTHPTQMPPGGSTGCSSGGLPPPPCLLGSTSGPHWVNLRLPHMLAHPAPGPSLSLGCGGGAVRPGAGLRALDRGCREAVLAGPPPSLSPGRPSTPSSTLNPSRAIWSPQNPLCTPTLLIKVPHTHRPLGLLVGLLEGSRSLGTRPLLRVSPTHAPHRQSSGS